MTPEQAERYARMRGRGRPGRGGERVGESIRARGRRPRLPHWGVPAGPAGDHIIPGVRSSRLRPQLEPHLALERLERTHTFHARTEPCYVCADLALLRQAIETLEAARTDARGERIMRAMARWENVDVASVREKLARLEAEVARLLPLAAPVWPEPPER